MVKINIRKASLDDLPKLLEFEQGIFDSERPFDKNMKDDTITYYDVKYFISDDNAKLLVAEHEGRIVGCGSAEIKKSKPYIKHPYHGYLAFMYVDPEYRGKGVNKQIIESLAKWCKSKNTYELILNVYNSNTAAIRAYEKAGFSRNIIEMQIEL